MIENERILELANCAIEALSAITTCFERDGFVAEHYVDEKATIAQRCAQAILSISAIEEEEE